MTLTYLGPTIGAGDLIVPAASEVALDPLLTEALVLLRASQFTGADGDGWVNEGTLGTVGDAVPQTALGSADSDAAPPARFTRSMFDQDLVMFTNAVDEGINPPSLFLTADSVATSITGDITLRVKGRAIPGWYASAGQAVLIRKADGTTPDPDYLNGCYGLNIEDDGDVRLDFTQGDDTDRNLAWANVFVDNFVGEYDLLMDLDVDNGASGHTGRLWQQDDAGAVSFAGTTWTLVSAQTGSGTTDIKNTTGPLLVGITKGFFEKAQVWSGLVGGTPTLVADFDPSDSAGENDPSWASAATGETWTASSFAVVLDTTTPGFAIGGTQNVNGWKIPDHNSLDFGTADGSVVLKVRMFEVADTNNETFTWAQKLTGTFGAPGSAGWTMADLKIDGFGVDFFVAGASEGTDTAAATTNAHTTGSNLVVVTLDRDGNAVGYLNGSTFGTPTAMSAVGSITNAADIIIGGTNNLMGVVEAFALYDRVLTSGEVAELSSLLA